MRKKGGETHQDFCNALARSVEKTSDRMVDLHDTEAVMLQYPGILNVKAYMVNSKKYGEVPVAAIVLQEDAEIDFEELRHYLKKRLIKIKQPVFIEKVKELPKI